MVTSAQGDIFLGLFPHCIRYGKGNSILSSDQCASFGHNFQEQPRRYDGAQKIITRYGYVFNLKYQCGLTYIPLEDPSDNDITDLTHVYFGSPGDWNPDNENENYNDDDDLWFDAVSDGKEMTDEEFLKPHDGWDLFSEKLKKSSEERILSYSNMCKKAVDFEGMSFSLAWKPIETVKRNFLAKTRFIENVFCLPLLHHYKSRFPSLNVNCLDEVYVEYTLLSNVEAHEGSTCAQLYCGKKYSFTRLFGMKTESEMPGTLMDFIRTFGAMKGLFSDNAKVHTGAAIKDILQQCNIDDM